MSDGRRVRAEIGRGRRVEAERDCGRREEAEIDRGRREEAEITGRGRTTRALRPPRARSVLVVLSLVASGLVALYLVDLALPLVKRASAEPREHVDARHYPWLTANRRMPTLASRFAPPAGYRRVPLKPKSFGAFLRHLPLRPLGTPVRAYDQRVILAGDDARLAAVVALPLVRGNLQQCADTVLRLRAEYLYRERRHREIAFHYTSGFLSRFDNWSRGKRPRVVGRRVVVVSGAPQGSGRASFERYLRDLFIYAGTLSIAREGKRVAPRDLAIGDYFVLGGSPGHTVIVLDLARDAAGHRVALFGQGFMPAQDLHVLRASDGSPWFRVDERLPWVKTPFWLPFPWSSLRRFR